MLPLLSIGALKWAVFSAYHCWIFILKTGTHTPSLHSTPEGSQMPTL